MTPMALTRRPLRSEALCPTSPPKGRGCSSPPESQGQSAGQAQGARGHPASSSVAPASPAAGGSLDGRQVSISITQLTPDPITRGNQNLARRQL